MARTTELPIDLSKSLVTRGPEFLRDGALAAVGSWIDGQHIGYGLESPPLLADPSVTDVFPAGDTWFLQRQWPDVSSSYRDGAQSPCVGGANELTSPAWQASVTGTARLSTAPHTRLFPEAGQLLGTSPFSPTRTTVDSAGRFWVLQPQGDQQSITVLDAQGTVVARHEHLVRKPNDLDSSLLLHVLTVNNQVFVIEQEGHAQLTPTLEVYIRFQARQLTLGAQGIAFGAPTIFHQYTDITAVRVAINLMATGTNSEVLLCVGRFDTGLSRYRLQLLQVSTASWTVTLTSPDDVSSGLGYWFPVQAVKHTANGGLPGGAARYTMIWADAASSGTGQRTALVGCNGSTLALGQPCTFGTTSTPPSSSQFRPLWVTKMTSAGTERIMVFAEHTQGNEPMGIVADVGVTVPLVTTHVQVTKYMEWAYGAVRTRPLMLVRASRTGVLLPVQRTGMLDPAEDLGLLTSRDATADTPESWSWAALARYAVDAASELGAVTIDETPRAYWAALAARGEGQQRDDRVIMLVDEVIDYSTTPRRSGINGTRLVVPRAVLINLRPAAAEAPRVVQCGNKSYVSGGLLRCFDGRDLREVAQSFAPSPLGSYTAGTAEFWAAEYAPDFAGDVRRSAVAGPLAVGVANDGVATVRAANAPGPDTFRARNFALAWVDTGSQLGSRAAPRTFNYSAGSLAYLLQAQGTFDYRADLATPGVPYATNRGAGEISAWAPPACSDVAIVRDRMVLLDATHPQRFWYSKPKVAGYEFEFAAELVGYTPASAGAHVAVTEFDGNILIVCERGIFAVGGSGLDATGGGALLSQPRLVSHEQTSRSARLSLVRLPNAVMWRGASGYVLLVSGWQIKHDVRVVPPAGACCAALRLHRSEVVFKVAGAPAQTYNYEFDKWSTEGNTPGLDAAQLLREATEGLVLVSPGLICQESAERTQYLELTTAHIAPAGIGAELSFNEFVLTGQLEDSSEPWSVNVEVTHNLGAAGAAPSSTTLLHTDTPSVQGASWTLRGRLDGRARAVSLRIRAGGPGRPRPLGLRLVISGEGTSHNTTSRAR